MIDPARRSIRAYREGIFPMALEDGEIGWFSPDPRGIHAARAFHDAGAAGARDPAGPVRDRVDRGFEAVMRACAERPATRHLDQRGDRRELSGAPPARTGAFGRDVAGRGTGRRPLRRASRRRLLRRVDVPSRHRRVESGAGGLVDRLSGAASLLDIQWVTPHLAQFGAVDIPRREYLARLGARPR